jgi:hypothetical protein
MQTLTLEEIDAYEFLAEHGEVERFIAIKKGRPTLIFKLPPPALPPIDPSESPNSTVCLDKHDIQAFAIGPHHRTQVERWIGWGLISAR